jgi:protein SCO1
MKNIIILLFMVTGSLMSCSTKDACCASGAKEEAMACHSEESIAGESLLTGHVTDMSLYNLESDWINEQGDKVKLAELAGKIQMVAMIYTGCDYACPRIIADLKRIEEGIKTYNRNDVGIVLVTMDPENDTPEKMKAFAAKNKLDASRWTLLSSTDSNILELAALLNVKYRKESNNYISHSNIITVLNTNGEIVHQQEGLGVDPDETVNAISGLLKSI